MSELSDEQKILTDEYLADLEQWARENGQDHALEIILSHKAERTLRQQAEQELDAWKPYKYDPILKTILPEKCLEWLNEVRAEVAAMRVPLHRIG